MSDYFSSTGAIFGAYSYIVVALNPKDKIASSCSHSVVKLLVFSIGLDVA